MIDLSQIREHMEVVGSDGRHVGRVNSVKGDEIELAKLDVAGGFRRHLIPLSWVETIQDGKLCLFMPSDEARATWKAD